MNHDAVLALYRNNFRVYFGFPTAKRLQAKCREVWLVCRPLTKLVPDCIARRSVASLGLEPAAAVGGITTAGMGEGLRRTGSAGRVRVLALSSAPCLQKKKHLTSFS